MKHRLWALITVMSGLVACGNSAGPEEQSASSHEVLIAVQLWSVRDAVKTDFEATLRSIADMGFDGVELARDYGPYSNDPSGLKAFLDELGLRVSSAHIGFDAVAPEAIEETVRFFETVGTDTLIIPWDERAWDVQRIDALVADLNQASVALATYGFRVGYHNHNFEFEAHEEGVFWDYLAANTRPEVLLQLDIGWVANAERDPSLYLERYATRTISAHYKAATRAEGDPNSVLGHDGLDWASITATAQAGGFMRWAILEQEIYPTGLTPLQAVAASKTGLDQALGRSND